MVHWHSASTLIKTELVYSSTMQSVTLCPQDKVEDDQHDYHDQEMTIVDLAQGSLQKRTSQVNG